MRVAVLQVSRGVRVERRATDSALAHDSGGPGRSGPARYQPRISSACIGARVTDAGTGLNSRQTTRNPILSKVRARGGTAYAVHLALLRTAAHLRGN